MLWKIETQFSILHYSLSSKEGINKFLLRLLNCAGSHLKMSYIIAEVIVLLFSYNSEDNFHFLAIKGLSSAYHFTVLSKMDSGKELQKGLDFLQFTCGLINIRSARQTHIHISKPTSCPAHPNDT